MLPSYNKIIETAEQLSLHDIDNLLVVIKLPPKRYKQLEEEFFYKNNPDGILIESDEFLAEVVGIPFLFLNQDKVKSDINKALDDIIEFKDIKEENNITDNQANNDTIKK